MKYVLGSKFLRFSLSPFRSLSLSFSDLRSATRTVSFLNWPDSGRTARADVLCDGSHKESGGCFVRDLTRTVPSCIVVLEADFLPTTEAVTRTGQTNEFERLSQESRHIF